LCGTILVEKPRRGLARAHVSVSLVYDSPAVEITLEEIHMRKLLSACALLLFALSPAIALAADITGTWTGAMKGPDGNADFQLSFTFKQDGTKFTGSVQGPQGEAIPITDGKLEGDKLTFSVSFNGMTITHEGTISGDEIKMTSKSDQGFGGEMTLKRTPPTAPPAGSAPPPSTAPPAPSTPPATPPQ
jgi:hypothetical protein